MNESHLKPPKYIQYTNLFAQYFDWTKLSLGPGSALGEKRKKSAWARKKSRGSLGREKGGPFPPPSLRSPIFTYFSYLTSFFAFPPHCGALSQAKQN